MGATFLLRPAPRFYSALYTRPGRLPVASNGHLDLSKTFRKVTNKYKTVQFGTVWYRLPNRNSLPIQELQIWDLEINRYSSHTTQEERAKPDELFTVD